MLYKKPRSTIIQIKSNDPKMSKSITIYGEDVITAHSRIQHLYEELHKSDTVVIKHIK